MNGNPEDPYGNEGNDKTPPTEQELRSELESCMNAVAELEAQAGRYLDMAKRIQADYDNYRKRAQKEKDEYLKSANDRILYELLSFVDDFERALSANATLEELKGGVAQVHANLLSLLESKGLKEVPCDGDFDPNLHEALCIGEGEEGKILETYQKGYALGPRVLRYAKVKVGKKSE